MNKLIMQTLKDIGVPVAFHTYLGKKTTYITFHVYLTEGVSFEDDKEVETGHYIQLDIWSKEDYTQLVKEVVASMENASFKRRNEVDLYEEDTKIYHKGLKFYYLEARECV